jgi:hypothetical protein
VRFIPPKKVGFGGIIVGFGVFCEERTYPFGGPRLRLGPKVVHSGISFIIGVVDLDDTKDAHQVPGRDTIDKSHSPRLLHIYPSSSYIDHKLNKTKTPHSSIQNSQKPTRTSKLTSRTPSLNSRVIPFLSSFHF